MATRARRIGGIEAGGTKFVCVVADEADTILAETVVRTTTPDETLGEAIRFFQGEGGVEALGVASFGPLVLDRAAPEYGRVAQTPKPGWTGADIVGTFSRALDAPVALDTDVNGAGLAEAQLGAGRGLDVVAYLTVGTGLGGGLIVRGRPVQGLTHPEMGHVKVRRHPLDGDFAGVCPFHGDCLEGMASGPSVMRRLGHPLSEAAADDPVWTLLGHYLGEFCATLTLVASPQRIILGGGVMGNAALFPRVRAACAGALGGYVQHPRLTADADDYIVPPGLGDRAGAIGALLLAEQALRGD
jgi:fructokinase